MSLDKKSRHIQAKNEILFWTLSMQWMNWDHWLGFKFREWEGKSVCSMWFRKRWLLTLLISSQHSGVNAGKKKIWKNLKQIMTLERGLPWKQDDPTCKWLKEEFLIRQALHLATIPIPPPPKWALLQHLITCLPFLRHLIGCLKQHKNFKKNFTIFFMH